MSEDSEMERIRKQTIKIVPNEQKKQKDEKQGCC